MNIIDFRIRPPYSHMDKDILYRQVQSGEMVYMSGKFNCTVPESAKQFSMDMLLKEMDECGIEKGVCPIRRTYGGTNETAVEISRDYGDRFATLAGIEPSYGLEVCMEEIEKYVINGPCVGISMEPVIGAACLRVNDESIMPIYEKCEKDNIPVTITFGGLCYKNIEYHLPGNLENVLNTFPDLKVIISHGGWPFVTETIGVAFSHQNFYIACDDYMLAPGHQAYVDAANSFLKEQMIYGSAYPINSIKEVLDFYLHCGIKEELLPNILYNNVKHALNI